MVPRIYCGLASPWGLRSRSGDKLLGIRLVFVPRTRLQYSKGLPFGWSWKPVVTPLLLWCWSSRGRCRVEPPTASRTVARLYPVPGAWYKIRATTVATRRSPLAAYGMEAFGLSALEREVRRVHNSTCSLLSLSTACVCHSRTRYAYRETGWRMTAGPTSTSSARQIRAKQRARMMIGVIGYAGMVGYWYCRTRKKVNAGFRFSLTRSTLEVRVAHFRWNVF